MGATGLAHRQGVVRRQVNATFRDDGARRLGSVRGMRKIASLGALLVCLGPALRGQTPAPSLDEQQAKLNATATQGLLAFARSAESNKMLRRAKTAYDMVVADYDPTNKVAAAALATKGRTWIDGGSDAQRRATLQAWTVLAKKLAPLHRELGKAFVDASDLDRGTKHLERCLAFDPSDVEAHERLGHESYRDFHGTADQIAFCKRLEAIHARAKELATTEFAPAPLPDDAMPEELRRSGLPMKGGRSRQWKVWTTSATNDAAIAMAQWAERGQELLEFLLPSGPARRAAIVASRPVSWVATVRDDAEWQKFFAANPQILEKEKVKEVPKAASFYFTGSGGRAVILRADERADADDIIAHVAMWGFAQGRNEGFGQGLVHTLTSLLLGTTLTWFGDEPATSTSKRALPRSEGEWTTRLREEMRAGKDWPLAQVPRERLDSFRESVRVKSWSFVTWLVARFPDRWTQVFDAIPSDKLPDLAAIEAIIAKELGCSVEQLDAEWRDWAGGDSPIAKATATAPAGGK